MKNMGIVKWMFALIVVAIIGFFGFVFKVNEGECAVVTRFGAVRAEVTEAGMYLRLPWPFEDVKKQDARKRYLDSGYLETLTHDKMNVIMQTYTIWSVKDPLRYYTSVGDTALAETYLSDLITNAKNGIMGNYDLSTLVSLDEEDIKIAEIEQRMMEEVYPHALEQYGVEIHELRIKRIGLPATNVQNVFAQMQADRQKYIDQLLAEGERDARIIRSESDAEVAAIVAARAPPKSMPRRSARWPPSTRRPTVRTPNSTSSCRSWPRWKTRWMPIP